MAEGRAIAGSASSASDATSPRRISARGWARILRRVGRQALDDRLMLYAAGIFFFALLSIAPVLVTAISVYAAVNTPQEALAQLSDVVHMLPAELQTIVAEQLTTITAASADVLTVRGLTRLVVGLWTATTAATYLVDALTLAYHETETRSLLRRSGLAVAFVMGGALLLGAVIAGAGMVAGWLDRAAGPVRAAAPAFAWLVLAALLAAALSLLYRFAADRKQARWRWIKRWCGRRHGGAVVATVLWLGSSVLRALRPARTQPRTSADTGTSSRPARSPIAARCSGETRVATVTDLPGFSNSREELATLAGLPGLLGRLTAQEAAAGASPPPPSLRLTVTRPGADSPGCCVWWTPGWKW